MTWKEDPSWYDCVEGQWILTNKAPESAQRSFKLYMEELRRYNEELVASTFDEDDG